MRRVITISYYKTKIRIWRALDELRSIYKCIDHMYYVAFFFILQDFILQNYITNYSLIKYRLINNKILNIKKKKKKKYILRILFTNKYYTLASAAGAV